MSELVGRPVDEPAVNSELQIANGGSPARPPSAVRHSPSVHSLLLVIILILSAAFRFHGLRWGEGQVIHPDEAAMIYRTGAVRTPGYLPAQDVYQLPAGCEGWGGYLDSHCSPLNPFNRGYGGQGGFVYGTLPLFATRAAVEWLNSGCSDPVAQVGQVAQVEGRLLPRLAGQWIAGPGAEACSGPYFTGLDGMMWTGRALSALWDLGTLLLLYLLARRLFGPGVALLAAALYAAAVLPIQQSHFFTVDSATTFFVTGALCFLVLGGGRLATRNQEGGANVLVINRYPLALFTLAGLSTGLAVACKMSVWPLALVGAGACVGWGVGRLRRCASLVGALGVVLQASVLLVLAGTAAFAGFRLAQPYAFLGPGVQAEDMAGPDWEWTQTVRSGLWGRAYDMLPEPLRAVLLPDPRFVGNVLFIGRLMSGDVDTPPDLQWSARAPLLFPWLNMVIWGLGVPLGLAAWAGWGVVGVGLLRSEFGGRLATRNGKGEGHSLSPVPSPWTLLLWSWATLFFLYQGTQWVKSMRYLLPVYPVFVIFAAVGVASLVTRSGRGVRPGWRFGLAAAVPVGALLWALAYSSIYSRPVTRVYASRWLYAHLPAGSTVANEHWDWGLPLPLDGQRPFGQGGRYRNLSSSSGGDVQNYNPDSPDKLAQMLDWLDEADVVVLASNRLSASISRRPDRYPMTAAYYRALYDGSLGFELWADFTSYPSLGPLQFPDDEQVDPPGPALYRWAAGTLSIPLPPAEEAFSVYDHPRVLVFRKTSAYSRDAAQRILSTALAGGGPGE